MIVDVHAHYTQAPPQLDAYRGKQLSNMNRPTKGSISISDEQIEQSVQLNRYPRLISKSCRLHAPFAVYRP